jgi:hypothetical protein
MTNPDGDESRRVRDAVAAVIDTCETAAALIAKMRDAQAAFDASGELEETLTKLKAAATDLRSLMVERIWSENELKLAELGQRIGGVSKQRASQRLKEARKIREARDGQ